MCDHYGVHFGKALVIGERYTTMVLKHRICGALRNRILHTASFLLQKTTIAGLLLLKTIAVSWRLLFLRSAVTQNAFFFFSFWSVPGNDSWRHWSFSLAGYIFEDDVGTWVKDRDLDRFVLIHSCTLGHIVHGWHKGGVIRMDRKDEAKWAMALSRPVDPITCPI